MAQFGVDISDDLIVLDNKLKTLKNEYDQYFIGTRKREPHQLRRDVNKMVVTYANISINNTGYRFKFNNLRSRYSTYKRLWDDTLRKIDEGRYERHLFRANLREREQADVGEHRAATASGDTGPSQGDLFEAYVTARESTGQGAEGLTEAKLAKVLEQQEAAIRKKTGCQRVRFRVVVEAGKAKLKATPLRG